MNPATPPKPRPPRAVQSPRERREMLERLEREIALQRDLDRDRRRTALIGGGGTQILPARTEDQ